MIVPSVQPDEWVPYNHRRQIEKKVLPEYYKEIRTHRKMFEIRKDDDGIQGISLSSGSGTVKSTREAGLGEK